MRKQDVIDHGIIGMLRSELMRCVRVIENIKITMAGYPKGNIVVKKIRAHGKIYEYYHLQWRDGQKVRSQHIKKRDLPDLQKKIAERERYRKNLPALQKRVRFLEKLIGGKVPRQR